MADTPSIHAALNAVKSGIGAVGKDQRNATQGFQFRGVDAVVNAAAPHLNQHGILVCPEVLSHTYDNIEIGKNRTPMAHVTLLVRYRFYGPAGDSVESTVFSESLDSGDKAAAKAMSVAYRIALLQTLNLPTTDPDPDYDSYERSPVQEAAQAPQWPSEPRRAEPAASRNQVKPRDPAEPPEKSWAERIAQAPTVEKLREVWKQAGAAGALQLSTVLEGGEKLSVQEALYRRNDELAVKSGSNGAGSAAG